MKNIYVQLPGLNENNIHFYLLYGAAPASSPAQQLWNIVKHQQSGAHAWTGTFQDVPAFIFHKNTD